MATAIGNILRTAHRKSTDLLNILSFPTHEPYETELCKTGHTFYSVTVPKVTRTWNVECRPVPLNYILLDPSKEADQLPLDVDIDLVLSHNRFGQFNIAEQFCKRYHVPHVCMEHTLPSPNWNKEYIEQTRAMKADVNLFISEYNLEQWGWDASEAGVIHHGIDSKVYSPNPGVPKKRHVLSVVNDWINRDWCCGYKIWERVTKGLPFNVRGNTPGLSTGTSSTQELVNEYRAAQIFLNTSTVSPVPMALLEAMSCGCAVVTTATCMLPEIVENGVNGFISNDEESLRAYLVKLLDDKELCKRLGAAARETTKMLFSTSDFVANWDKTLRAASELPPCSRLNLKPSTEKSLNPSVLQAMCTLTP